MNKEIKICFIADKHSLYDDRIYWKMAVPLKKRGFDIHYLLIDHETIKGVTKEGIKYEILGIKTFSKNRYLNFILKNLNPFNNYKKIYKKSKKINADIYHFHDLWINRIGKKLKNLPQKPVVIYDAREPYAEDYISYIKVKGVMKYFIKIFSLFVDKWEKSISKNYDLVISNEEIVRDRFRKKIGLDKAEVLYNYTDIYKEYKKIPFKEKEYDFIYCGGITKERGAWKILEATLLAKERMQNIKVAFVGSYSPNNLKNELRDFILKNNLEQNIILYSAVDYNRISEFYNKSRVGLVTLFPNKTFKISMPIKIFEYMAFGLPIIGSNFGHMKEYIEEDNCGIIVDPLDAIEISNAMTELLTNRKKYDLYSKNGREATLKKYKWDFEFDRLIGYYTKLLNERQSI